MCSRNHLTVIFLLLFFHSLVGQNLSISVNNGSFNKNKVVYIQVGDILSLKADDSISGHHLEELYWVKYEPAPKSYDNMLLKNRYGHHLMDYKIIPIKKVNKNENLIIHSDTCSNGTSYWGIMQVSSVTRLNYQSFLPLYLATNINIIQVISRLDNSYLGYLSELFNTPFIHSPKFIPSVGHQTDIHLGSDCAEFLIYGKRRQNFRIPYCGPKGIINYLDPVREDNLFNGCIIHFGEQVALLFEDKGIKGQLDDDDILLQCYLRGPEKIKLRDSEFRNYNYKAYRWKSQYDISTGIAK